MGFNLKDHSDCSMEIRPGGGGKSGSRETPTSRLLSIPARDEGDLDQNSHSGGSRKKRWDSRYDVKRKLTRFLSYGTCEKRERE